MWVEGFERILIPGKDGGTYVRTSAPYRLVLHTTEGLGSIEAQVNGYRSTGNYPHVTADPITGRVAQHVSLDRSVTTAQNDSGGVETNRLRAVQVEIIAKADFAATWSPRTLDWLGQDVVGPICRARGIGLFGPPRNWVDRSDGFIARENAPQRLSYEEWTAFGGVCGHQHLPENDHWDPGKVNIDRVFAAANELHLSFPEPPAEEDLVKAITFMRDATNGQTWVTNGFDKVYLVDAEDVTYWQGHWQARGADSTIYDVPAKRLANLRDTRT
jgi:hypothetical protein